MNLLETIELKIAPPGETQSKPTVIRIEYTPERYWIEIPSISWKHCGAIKTRHSSREARGIGPAASASINLVVPGDLYFAMEQFTLSLSVRLQSRTIAWALGSIFFVYRCNKVSSGAMVCRVGTTGQERYVEMCRLIRAPRRHATWRILVTLERDSSREIHFRASAKKLIRGEAFFRTGQRYFPGDG